MKGNVVIQNEFGKEMNLYELSKKLEEKDIYTLMEGWLTSFESPVERGQTVAKLFANGSHRTLQGMMFNFCLAFVENYCHQEPMIDRRNEIAFSSSLAVSAEMDKENSEIKYQPFI